MFYKYVNSFWCKIRNWINESVFEVYGFMYYLCIIIKVYLYIKNIFFIFVDLIFYKS